MKRYQQFWRRIEGFSPVVRMAVTVLVFTAFGLVLNLAWGPFLWRNVAGWAIVGLIIGVFSGRTSHNAEASRKN